MDYLVTNFRSDNSSDIRGMGGGGLPHLENTLLCTPLEVKKTTHCSRPQRKRESEFIKYFIFFKIIHLTTILFFLAMIRFVLSTFHQIPTVIFNNIKKDIKELKVHNFIS
jgi:hypothetical protein